MDRYELLTEAVSAALVTLLVLLLAPLLRCGWGAPTPGASLPLVWLLGKGIGSGPSCNVEEEDVGVYASHKKKPSLPPTYYSTEYLNR